MEEIPVRHCLLCFAAIFHFDCDFAIRRPAVRPSLASSDYYCTSGPRPPHTPTSGRRLNGFQGLSLNDRVIMFLAAVIITERTVRSVIITAAHIYQVG